MRLINAETLELEDFNTRRVPPYAILSHTWGEDEVTYQDLRGYNQSMQGFNFAPSDPMNVDHSIVLREGYKKIKGTCEITLGYGLKYTWVDTCCIDKTSSAELSESINSMYKFYKRARICLVYLSDLEDEQTGVETEKQLKERMQDCRWFGRGWTLQELIAPSYLEVFSKSWTKLGSRSDLAQDLSLITGIESDYLLWKDVKRASVAKRMSWVAKRTTTRLEDMAYCLLGVFDVNMPLLYGEGAKAFQRLQEEIMKDSDDQSLFAWGTLCELSTIDLSRDLLPGLGIYDLLARSPKDFAELAHMVTYPGWESRDIFVKTNRGVQASLPLGHTAGIKLLSLPYRKNLVLAALACHPQDHAWYIVAIPLYQDTKYTYSRFAAKANEPFLFLVPRDEWIDDGLRTIFIQGERKKHTTAVHSSVILTKGRRETSTYLFMCPTSPVRLSLAGTKTPNSSCPVQHIEFGRSQVEHVNNYLNDFTFPLTYTASSPPNASPIKIYISLNLYYENVAIHTDPLPPSEHHTKSHKGLANIDPNRWHPMKHKTTIEHSSLTFDVLWWEDNAGPGEGHRYQIGLDCWTRDEIRQPRIRELREQQHNVTLTGWTEQDVAAQVEGPDALLSRHKFFGESQSRETPADATPLPLPFSLQQTFERMVSRTSFRQD